VEFRPGRIHGADDGGGDVLTFEPAAPHLAAGAETLVRVGIDLTAWDKAETFDVGVDVLGNGRLLFKLWVRAESPGREEQGGTDTL
jgi:hypothetical protein